MNCKKLIIRSFLICIVTIPTEAIAQEAFKGTSMDSMKIADSFYYAQDWAHAKKIYEAVLRDTSHNSIAWNRLGFSNYNLGHNDEALEDFQKALANSPMPLVKASALSRMARVHAIKNENQKAITALDSAISSGYSNLPEMDSLKEFNTLRREPSFVKLREKMYGIAYPCMADPHAREFDFWAGDWDVYPTGTKTLVGQSSVQIISGGCALLENWTSPASTGKSINYIDPATHKWKQAWAGSYAAGIQEFVNGEYKDSAMRFVFEFKDVQGRRNIGRFIFYNEGPNQVRQFNETSVDDGKTWITSYDFTYVRKK